MEYLFRAYYSKPLFFGLFIQGTDVLRANKKFPTLESMQTTHVPVHTGTVRSERMEPVHSVLDRVFCQMQAENWSPNGEKADLIRKLKLDHTSMSVGDIIEYGGIFYLVDNLGFTRIED